LVQFKTKDGREVKFYAAPTRKSKKIKYVEYYKKPIGPMMYTEGIGEHFYTTKSQTRAQKNLLAEKARSNRQADRDFFRVPRKRKSKIKSLTEEEQIRCNEEGKLLYQTASGKIRCRNPPKRRKKE